VSLVHRAKKWWGQSPLGILVGSVVALAATCLLFWQYFSSEPPIPVVIKAIRTAEAMPSVAQLVGLAIMALALVVQVALFVALILRYRAQDRQLHEDLSVVVRELQGSTGREEDLRTAVAVLRSLAEPNEVLVSWRRKEEERKAELAAEEELRKQLREADSLRPLRPSEIGRMVRDLPGGIYCFIETLGLADFPLIPQSAWRLVAEDELSFAAKLRFAVTQRPILLFRDQVEIHLAPSGALFLVGFAPELEATDIESRQARRARLYLRRAEHAPVAVRVDAEWIDRAIQFPTDPAHLDLELRPPADPPPSTDGE